MGLCKPYIKTEWHEALINYKYSCIDDGITYVYCTSPLCNRLVLYIPEWVAPNLITLTGLLCVLTMNILTTAYAGFGVGQGVSWWACISAGVLYAAYHILDLLDGKQARKTGNSSPMGLLFDHGCDSLTTLLCALSLGDCAGINSWQYYFILWLTIVIPFFLATWEEYYTGVLHLPVLNGVTEGAIVVILFFFISAAVPRSFFLKEISVWKFKFLLNELLILVMLTIGQVFALFSIIKVFKKPETKICKSFVDLLCFAYLCLCLYIVLAYSNCTISTKYFKLVFVMFGLAYSKLVAHLQIAHLCEAPFLQYRKSMLVTCFVLSTLALLKYSINLSTMYLDYFIISFLILQFCVWFHMCYYVTEEMCSILNIKRFKVKNKIREPDF